MLFHSLTNFEIQNYCLNEPKFKGFHSINNLPKIKDVCNKSYINNNEINNNFVIIL